MMKYCRRLPAMGNGAAGRCGSSLGFTLIEVLMVLAILSIVFGTIFKNFVNLNRSYTAENVKAGIQQGARISVEFMVQDIRLAGLDPLGTAAAGITADLPTSAWIEFKSDANFDGTIVDTDPYENIRYELIGTELRQRNRNVWATLLDNVTDLSFTFLDIDDQPTTDNDAIRSVIVSLTMEGPAGRAEPVSRSYTTTVRCRNL